MTDYELGKQWCDAYEGVEINSTHCEAQALYYIEIDHPMFIPLLDEAGHTRYYPTIEAATEAIGAYIRACREACAVPGEMR